MNTRTLIGSLALVSALTLGACRHMVCNETEDETKCKEVKPGVVASVNKMCAIEPEDPVNPAVAYAEWKGQKVGFCCNGCVPKWNKLTPAEKDAALATAMKAK